MAETNDTATQAKSYPALLWHDIRSRKSEFFLGLILSIVSGIVTVWLQYRDGMLERKHFWDGIVTAAVPVLGIIVIFTLVEVYRAAASLNRTVQAEIEVLKTRRESAKVEGLSPVQRAVIREVLTKYQRPNDFGQDTQYRYFVIFPIPGVPEASALAAQLRAVFGECGLDTQLISNELPKLRDTSRFNHGVWLRGRGDIDRSYYDLPTLTVLREALERAAIPFQYIPDDVGDVELIIGAPPNSPSDAVVAELSTAAYHSEVNRLQEKIAALTLVTAGRHLQQDQKDAIAANVSAAIAEYMLSWGGAEEEWPTEQDGSKQRFCVSVISIGGDREVIVYRNEIAESFAQTFAIQKEQWTAGHPDCEAFNGVITVTEPTGKPNNIRPLVIQALKTGHIDVREAPFPWNGPNREISPAIRPGESYNRYEPVAYVVVGQRSPVEVGDV